jgi:hypothetical protein
VALVDLVSKSEDRSMSNAYADAGVDVGIEAQLAGAVVPKPFIGIKSKGVKSFGQWLDWGL